jgi:hypothetical protein
MHERGLSVYVPPGILVDSGDSIVKEISCIISRLYVTQSAWNLVMVKRELS